MSVQKERLASTKASLLQELCKHLNIAKDYGDYYMAHCPETSYHNHGDSNPSLLIHKNGWYRCYNPACPLNEGGSIRILAEKLGIEIEEDVRDADLTAKAIDYIAKRLNLSKEEAKKFMRRFNIQPARYQGMEGVMIDLFNGQKKFRSIDGKVYRVLGTKDKEGYIPFSTLIDPVNPSEQAAVVIAEGTFDALTFWRLKISAISKEGNHYSAQKIAEWFERNHLVAYLTFDNDKAGEKYREELIKELVQRKVPCYVLPIPEQFNDVNEAYMADPKGFKIEPIHFIEWISEKYQHLLRMFEETGEERYRLLFVRKLILYYKLCTEYHVYEAILKVFNRHGIPPEYFEETFTKIEIAQIEEEKRKQAISKMKEAIKQIENGSPLEQELESLKAALSSYKAVDIRTIDQRPELIEFEEDQPIKLELLPEVRLYPSDILLISARTKNGKTTLALNLAKELLDQNHRVLFVTYELLARQIMNFFSGVAKRKHFSEITSQDRREIARQYAGRLALEEGLTIEEISAYVRAWQPSVFIIDYDQMIRTSGRFESEERRVSFIVQTLKGLALDTKSLCILLSQENEEGQARWSREKEFFASVHLRLEKKKDDDDLITCEVKLNRYGKAGTKSTLEVDWKTRRVTPFHKGVDVA